MGTTLPHKIIIVSVQEGQFAKNIMIYDLDRDSYHINLSFYLSKNAHIGEPLYLEVLDPNVSSRFLATRCACKFKVQLSTSDNLQSPRVASTMSSYIRPKHVSSPAPRPAKKPTSCGFRC